MPTRIKSRAELDEIVDPSSAGGERSEPGGRAQRDAGAARQRQDPWSVELPPEVRDRLSDAPIDVIFDLLDESGSMLRRQAEALGLPGARLRRPPGS